MLRRNLDFILRHTCPLLYFPLFLFLFLPFLLFLLLSQILRGYIRQLNLCGLRHGIFPYGCITLPGIFHLMDGKPIAILHAKSGTIHILRLHLGTVFPGTTADKDTAQQKFPTGMKQIHAYITAAHIHFFHIHLNAALGAAHINLGETNIFPFFPALIGIYVRNQSPIIRHSSHPLRD